MKLNFLIIFLLVVNAIIGQTCTCPIYDASLEKFDQVSDKMDSVALGKLLITLQSQRNDFCQFLAICEQIKFCTESMQFERSAVYLDEAESLSLKLNCSLDANHHLWLLKADYYQEMDSIELGIKYALQLLTSAEKYKNDGDILKAISQIGTLFVRQGQENEFKPYLLKAKRIIEKSPVTPKLSEQYNWLARYYETEYTLTEKKTALDTAEIFANKAFVLANQFRQTKQLQYVYQVFDAIAYHKGDFKKSLSFQDSTYRYLRMNKENGQIPVYFQTKAMTLLELNDKLGTILHQDSAIYYARKYSQPSFLANILKQGAEVYEGAGDKDKALVAFKEFTVLYDSLKTDKRSKIINELEQKYQKENNEKKILQLSNERSWLWISLLLAGAIGLIYFYFTKRKEHKQKELIMETEQRLNRARMNPHFFFNALASLQSFAINETDSILLAENLSKFSHIMRETLENTYREYVTIEQEESFLREYLELQQLRFPGKFDFALNMDYELDKHDLLIPSMIVQPFIENSVEHGFADISHLGILKITFEKAKDEIIITVYDNGSGLNYNTTPAKPYISRASQIVKDRIYLLNMKLKSQATFSIINNTLEGVTVTIRLPLIYEN